MFSWLSLLSVIMTKSVQCYLNIVCTVLSWLSQLCVGAWFIWITQLSTHSLPVVCSVEDLRTGCSWFKLPARPLFVLKINDSHCDKIHSSPTAVHCFDDGYVEKQPVAWEEAPSPPPHPPFPGHSVNCDNNIYAYWIATIVWFIVFEHGLFSVMW